MSNDTVNLIIKAAQKEYLTKGYNKSALRNIAKEAGVTTGAIYFFFENKEDLFKSVIKAPLEELKKSFSLHSEREKRNFKNNIKTEEEEDVRAAREIVNIMFKNKDSMRIILANREHPVIKEWMDEMIQYSEKQAREYFRILNIDMEKSICHWLSHIQFERFIYIFEHCKNIEEAEKELYFMVKFIRGGFYSLIKSSD